MCCLFAILLFLGPRATLAIWWLLAMERFSRMYDTFLWPFLGFLFLPWTTLMWAIILWFDPVTGVSGWNWIWIALGVIADIASYSGSGYYNRDRIPGYSGSAARL